MIIEFAQSYKSCLRLMSVVFSLLCVADACQKASSGIAAGGSLAFASATNENEAGPGPGGLQELQSENPDWIDPNDMLGFDPSTNSMRKSAPGGSLTSFGEKCEAELSRFRQKLFVCEQRTASDGQCPGLGGQSAHAKTDKNLAADATFADETIYFTHLVRNVLKTLRLDHKPAKKKSYIYEAHIELSDVDLEFLNDFLAHGVASDVNRMHRLMQIMSRLFRHVRSVDRPIEVNEYAEPSFWDAMSSHASTVIQVLNVCILVPSLVLLLRRFTSATYWQLTLGALFIFFWLSVGWTWFHLYKVKQAEKQARLFEDVPLECLPEYKKTQSSLSKAFLNWMQTGFAFNSLSTRCAQYQKDLMIDPFWEVTPTAAIADTIAKFFLEPLALLGHSLGLFFRSFYAEIPFLYVPLASAAMLAGLFIIGLLFCGCSIRLPFGILRIDTRAPGIGHVASSPAALSAEGSTAPVSRLPQWDDQPPQLTSGHTEHVEHAAGTSTRQRDSSLSRRPRLTVDLNEQSDQSFGHNSSVSTLSPSSRNSQMTIGVHLPNGPTAKSFIKSPPYQVPQDALPVSNLVFDDKSNVNAPVEHARLNKWHSLGSLTGR